MSNKTVFISGTTSGIGKACAYKFAAEGYHLILCARRTTILEEIAADLTHQFHIEVETLGMDVRERTETESTMKSLLERKTIDILINNAGLALGMEKFYEGSVDDWETMIDTNIKGLLYVCRAVVRQMVDKGTRGSVINIGSLAGVTAYPNGAVYCATKTAVKFISDGLRMDLVDKPIRVTNIEPGLVETNFSKIRFHGDENRADAFYQGIKPLTGEDIADCVYFAASAPEHVQICEMLITATHQASATVVYRKQENNL